MPMPHQEMRRLIKRRIHGKEGTERIRILNELLGEFPGYYSGPYGDLRKWVHQLIDEARLRRSVKYRDEYHVPKDGCAQVVLVGPPNAGKSTLLRRLTGRPVAVGNYRFTTLRPFAGALHIGGARVQLVDLPGLVEGAREGAGGGRLVLASVRAADAMLLCLPCETDGFLEGLAVAEEVREAGIGLPAAILLTKADLPGAVGFRQEAEQAFPGLPCLATAEGADPAPMVDLIWAMLDLIRVWPAPRGKRAPEPVVLPTGSSLAELVEALNSKWVPLFRQARVTGPSARFAGQPVGLSHLLADGDEVELILTR
jgi:small GTP-binding protein